MNADTNKGGLARHSASGANAGYTFQFERALSWLAKSPAQFAVGIETADDVVVADPGGAMLLEQDKHSVRVEAAPFGDTSKDLWKTLAIWVEALTQGELSHGFARFLMVTNKVLPDCIAVRISLAEDEDSIDACISDLEKIGLSPSKGIVEWSTTVLANAARPHLRYLISNCSLADGDAAASGNSLRKETIAELQLPEWAKEHAESIADELLGWLHRVVLEGWQKGVAGWVQRDHFVTQMHAVLDARKRRKSRERAENLIPLSETDVGGHKGRPFVKQLHMVTDDDALVDSAIGEYIRCNIEKSRLSVEGDLTDSDWLAFEATLVARWKKIKARVTRMSEGRPEADIGFAILSDTTMDHREKLAGSDTEQVYLTSGSYHRLADQEEVGWHPRYQQLLKTRD